MGSSITITYSLNQTADRGVMVNILQGSTVVATIAGGTNMGLNSVLVMEPTWRRNLFCQHYGGGDRLHHLDANQR